MRFLCFNSATPACAWRRPPDNGTTPCYFASIRPRLLARGDSSPSRFSRTHPARFNSATPACAWRPTLVEACKSAKTASIRPRLLARGDVRANRYTKSDPRTLQFGHACLRVETTSNQICSMLQYGFNSATPACAWRRGEVERASCDMAKLQFGHACLRVETRCD